MNGFGGRVRACRSIRLMLLAQLGATLVVLGWLPGNPAKLIAMALIWWIGFNRIAGAELVMMGAVDLLFVLMNLAALRRGIFAFDHADLFGMPIYEYLMWGFYVLHTIRFVDGAPPPRGRILVALAAAGGFAATFATIAAPTLLLLASGAVLTIGIVVFHEKMDFAYAGYMAVVGALVEHVGVVTGQWHYPGEPWGGVPLWFLTMWAGVGLFSRRLVVPLMAASRRGPAGGF
jgi:hypothetical protein